MASEGASDGIGLPRMASEVASDGIGLPRMASEGASDGIGLPAASDPTRSVKLRAQTAAVARRGARDERDHGGGGGADDTRGLRHRTEGLASSVPFRLGNYDIKARSSRLHCDPVGTSIPGNTKYGTYITEKN